MVISGQTALHTNFYAAFCFLAHEHVSDYRWGLQQLRDVYLQLELPDPTVIIIDMERALMSACEEVFQDTNHLLCLWHISKNIVAKCHNSFKDKETWNMFYSEWKLVVYASSEEEFWTQWNALGHKWQDFYAGEIEYLANTYINDFRHHFIKAFTNKVLHFDITTTSRGEGTHAVLKRQLGTSTGDLGTVVKSIELLLTNELHNHLIAFDEAKMRYPLDLRKAIYSKIAPHITSVAIRKINSQYESLTNQPTVITACTGVFTTTTGLPCKHRIQEYLFQGTGLQV